MQECWRADITSRDGMPRLLNQRISAIVERHSGDDFCVPGLLDKLSGLGGRSRQRFVGHDMFSFGERSRDDLEMQMIRRGNVHDLNVRVLDQRIIVAVTFPHPKLVRFSVAGFVVAAGNSDHIHKAKASDGVDVMWSDEAGANNSHSDLLHRVLLRTGNYALLCSFQSWNVMLSIFPPRRQQ